VCELLFSYRAQVRAGCASFIQRGVAALRRGILERPARGESAVPSNWDTYTADGNPFNPLS